MIARFDVPMDELLIQKQLKTSGENLLICSPVAVLVVRKSEQFHGGLEDDVLRGKNINLSSYVSTTSYFVGPHGGDRTTKHRLLRQGIRSEGALVLFRDIHHAHQKGFDRRILAVRAKSCLNSMHAA